MLPLPPPQGGGSIEELASFLNVRNRDDLVLVVAWLLATLRAGGPYPVLAISGEQGSAKTVLSKLLKDLVDPNVAPVRASAISWNACCGRAKPRSALSTNQSSTFDRVAARDRNADRARRCLGWSPERRFEDTVDDVLNDWRARVAARSC
jgi:nucleoside-diphosphate-sugar epimerase